MVAAYSFAMPYKIRLIDQLAFLPNCFKSNTKLSLIIETARQNCFFLKNDFMEQHRPRIGRIGSTARRVLTRGVDLFGARFTPHFGSSERGYSFYFTA